MTPTIKYSPADNAAYIRLSAEKVLESAEVFPDVVFDYDAQGRIVGIELLDAKAQLPGDAPIEAAQLRGGRSIHLKQARTKWAMP